MGLGAYTLDSHNCQRVVVHGSVRKRAMCRSADFRLPDFLNRSDRSEEG